MRYFFLFILAALISGPLLASSGPKDSTTVYIFMHHDCVITQNYTLLLQQLHETYASDQLAFVGVFPDFSSKPDDIEAFRQKYQIPFALKTDYFKTLTKELKATVTPEVVVYNHSTETIRYRGRIDNMYFRVGKKRTVVTTSELEDALKAIQNNEPIAVAKTTPVGCFINFKRGPQGNNQ
jgi:thiol-disulfide isomerase/thioredoxin